MSDRRRHTSYADVCPFCGTYDTEPSPEECRYCGWPYGKDWATIEIDLDTDMVLRTVVPAQLSASEEET
jgi:hypothetical protein